MTKKREKSMYTREERKTINKALRILRSKFTKTDSFTSSGVSRKYFQLKLVPLEHEVFAAVFLNNQNMIIKYQELFSGTIDGSSVYPREVVKACLKWNAAAVIFAHNHPSGVAEPSQADIRITQRLVSILDVVDVRVLDHIIVGADKVTSLGERGLL